MRSKGKFFVALVLAIWTVSAGLALAKVDFHIKSLGNAGDFRPGYWAPICLTIENFPEAGAPSTTGKEFKGEVIAKAWSNTRLPYVFRRQVNVPWLSRRNVFLYVKAASYLVGSQATVSLVNEQGKVIKELPLTPIIRSPGPFWGNSSLALIVNVPGQKVQLPQFTDLEEFFYKATVDAEELPDRWYGYQAVDLVIIPKYSVNMFNQSQQRAILKWVNLGGRLLIIGGKNFQSYKGSFLESILPGKFHGTKGITLSTVEAKGLKILASYMEPENAEIIWQEKGLPLMVRKALGMGELWVANFDFQGDVVEHPEFRRLALDLLSPNRVFQRDDLFLNQFASSLDLGLGKAVSLPSIYIIGAILLCYFLALGPVNFLLLRQKKRLELAWITVPAIVALFTLSIYFTGLFAKGSQVVFREFNVIWTKAASNTGRVTNLSYLFSPRTESYNLNPQGEDSTIISLDNWDAMPPRGRQFRPFTRTLPWQTSQWALRAPTTIKLTSQGMAIEEKALRQWTLFFIESIGSTNFKGLLEAEATRTGNYLLFAMKNMTPYQIIDASLCAAGKAGYIGDIKPGETKTAQLTLIDSAAQPPNSMTMKDIEPDQMLRLKLSSVDMAMGPVFDRLDKLSEPLKDELYNSYEALRDCMRMVAREATAFKPLSVYPKVYLIGLLEQGQRISIDQAAKSWDCHIMVAEIPVSSQEEFLVPGQLVQVDMGRGRYSGPGTLSLQLSANSKPVMFSSLPELAARYDIKQLSLKGSMRHQGQVDFDFFIYDFINETWQKQSGKEIAIDEPYNYTSPFRGIMFIRVESKPASTTGSPRYYGFAKVDITTHYSIKEAGAEKEL